MRKTKQQSKVKKFRKAHGAASGFLFLAVFLSFTFLVLPLNSVNGGGEFFCSWDSSQDPPCQYNSDTCDEGDVPGDCGAYVQGECANFGHLCIDNPNAIDLQVNYPPIPTPYGFIDLDELASDGEIDINTIIVFLYSIGIWMAGLIAFIGLIFAGFTYIWAGASPSAKNKAKKRFVNVLWGLAILLLVNVIINVINPNILKLERAELFGIDAEELLYERPVTRINPPSGGGVERDDLFEICLGFTDTSTKSSPEGCVWNGEIIESETTEWCNWCEQENGGNCEASASDPGSPERLNVRECVIGPADEPDEEPESMPDQWVTYMLNVCQLEEASHPDGSTVDGALCGLNQANDSGINWVTCKPTEQLNNEGLCPENFISECESWGGNTDLETTTTSDGDVLTCTWVGS